MSAARIILSIIPRESNPNFRAVCCDVDAGEPVVLSAADVEALGLEVGMEWTEAVEDAVQGRLAVAAARQDALGRLARRMHIRADLAAKLSAKHDADAIDGALDELAADGWIDDHAAGMQLVERWVRKAPMGAEMLAARLVERGIEADTADAVVEMYEATHDARAMIERYIEDALAGADTAAARQSALQRACRGLARRGLDADAIQMTAASYDVDVHNPESTL